jgi:GxxExxY protein
MITEKERINFQNNVNLVNPVQTDLTGRIIGSAMKVHRTLGAGFLESVYQNALLHELCLSGLSARTQWKIPVYYEGIVVGDFMADILVELQIILELKAVEKMARAHEVQLVNYLTATGKDLGLLLNFGAGSLEFKRKYRFRQDLQD